MQNENIQDTELLNQLLNSDMAINLKKQIINDKLEGRLKLVSEVHKQKLRLKELSALNKKIEAAEKNKDEAQKIFETADDQYRKLHREHYALTLNVTARIGRFRGQLRDTAPAYIVECKRWVNEDIVETQRVSLKEGAIPDKSLVNVETGKPPRDYYSCYDSVTKRLAALRAMSKIVDDWAISAFSFDEMKDKFELLKNNLPEIKTEKVVVQ